MRHGNAAKTSLVLLAAAVLGLLAARYLRDARPAVPLDPVAVGDVLPIEDLELEGAGRTLLVALSPDCSHCTDSMPFLRELVLARNLDRRDLEVVALVADDGDLGREARALASAGVPLDRVLAADFEPLGIPGTPYFVLVDRSGRVERVWRGSVDETRGAGILAELGLL